jgi:hypothetical protein
VTATPHPPYALHLTPDQRVRFDEIAAYLEYEQGQPRAIAEQLAILQLRAEMRHDLPQMPKPDAPA